MVRTQRPEIALPAQRAELAARHHMRIARSSRICARRLPDAPHRPLMRSPGMACTHIIMRI